MKPNITYSAELNDGIAAFRRGEYETSYRIFSRIIQTKAGAPELEEAQWYLARSSEQLERIDEARRQYALFAKNFPASRHAQEARKKAARLAPSSASGAQPSKVGTPPPATAVQTQATTTPTATAGTQVPTAAIQTSGSGGQITTDESKTPATSGQRIIIARRPSGPWYGRFSGSLTTEYSYDVLLSPSPSTNTQNRLSEYMDFRWKNGRPNDIRLVFSGMYSNDFLISENTRYRISKLFAEYNSPTTVYSLRLGRQPSSGDTLFNRFDGLALAYRPLPAIGLNVSGGFPVDIFDRNRIRIQSDRSFYDVYVALNDFYHVSGRIYHTQELNRGFSTRNAVGFNAFWLYGNTNVSAIVDYDLDFGDFNDQMLGVDYGRKNVHYSAAAERRKNPFLSYETALFDPNIAGATPPITSFDDLVRTRSRDEIRTLAEANTTDSLEFRAGVAIDFSSVWRGDLKVAHATNEVVDFTTGRATKTADRYSVFISERNGLKWSELWTLLLLYQPGTDFTTSTALTTLSKFWKNGTTSMLRFRYERSDFDTSGTRWTRLVPGLALTRPFLGKMYGTLEADYTIEKNSTSPDAIRSIQSRVSLTIPF